jgi:predicted enzyme related to lactoylglutathione lyase
METITSMFCVLPVTDRAAALDWYAVFFGRPTDEIMGAEALWQVSNTAWLVVDEHTERAGGAMLTLGVEGFDEILARLVDNGVHHESVETYGNGVRHVTILDPDGNSLSLAGEATK